MLGRDKPVDQWGKIQDDLQALPEEDEALGSEERVPCSDEACVGSVGEDGRCRVCGVEYCGELALPPADAAGEGSLAADAVEDEGQGSQDDATAEWEDDGAEAEGDRVLCSDESCIGSIGEDKCCRVCGLRWKEGGYTEGEPLRYREES